MTNNIPWNAKRWRPRKVGARIMNQLPGKSAQSLVGGVVSSAAFLMQLIAAFMSVRAVHC